ncbi:TonB-dependent receptor domain-containing protein [Acanthopleuribacter pedis]|uniref:TonB-dependent receptor n=1 Tax=Acanthopleuribacter pedis TaxID=442870 RepID=A0A8J7Q490_9BACT|nr:TonB-dependent receptor [Acanthopleuribacter pedis]MBO1320287.1 TonB-dependent receptor [Acanthopleuribacter pedis]
MTHFQRALWLACFLIPLSLTAQTANPTTDDQGTTVEENLTVWATEVRISSVKFDDQVVAIKQPDHISDLLRTVPGVDVGGAHSLNQRITIRSLGDRDLHIAIDGAQQNSYMYHHMGNLQIHADILKAVDIEVGAGSVIHGGLGGSVQMETKDAADLLKPGQSFGARVQTHLADNERAGATAAAYGRGQQGFDFLAYYHYVDRDNFSVGGDTIRNAAGETVPGTDGTVRGLAGELGNALFKFGWEPSPEQRFEVSFEQYRDEGDYSYRPDMGLATDIAIADNLGLPLVYPTEFSRDTIALNHQLVVGDNTRIESTLYRNQSELVRDESGVAAVFGGATDVRGEALNTGLRITARTALEGAINHNLTYGVSHNQYDTAYRTDADERSDEELTQTSLFVEDRIEFQNGMALVPGLRYDHADVGATLVDEGFDGVSAAIAFHHQVNEAFAWRLSGTQVFKAPEIGEVFVGAGLYETANNEIDAETGLNTEIGFNYTTSLGESTGFTVGLTLFQTTLSDYIYDYAPNPVGRYWKDNIGDMRLDGGEFTLGFQTKIWDALLSFDTAQSDLDAFDSYAELDGVRLDRTQGDTIALELGVLVPNTALKLHWDSLYVAGVDAAPDLDGPTLDNSKKAYAVHNLSGRWSPKNLPGLALTLGIDNVFDRFYASQSSRTGVSFHPRFGELYLQDYEPGRNIKATLAYSF